MTAMKPGDAPNALLNSLEQGAEVTVQQVRDDFNLDRRQAYNAISRLENRGYLRHVRTSTWAVTKEGLQAVTDGVSFGAGPNGPSGVIPQPKNTFRQRAWQAMRVRRIFTIGDIVSDAGRTSEARDNENAMRYIRELRKAGILGELPRRVKGSAIGFNGFKRFILRNNLGPKAPAYRAKQKVVHDFNSGEDIPCVQV